MMKTTLLSIAALSIALSAPAFAAGSTLDQQSQMAQMLLQYDTNKDGVISRAEIEAGKAAEFTTADTNADTFLSWEEFKAWNDAKKSAQTTSIFNVMDADMNGSISSAEFVNTSSDRRATQAASMFALADTNQDGALSPEELTAMRAGNGDSVEKLLEMFTGMDTDADKRLSATEFTGKTGRAGNMTRPGGTTAPAGRTPGSMRR
jgi:Ca2+-binding EF-hand superfamily protein